MVSFGRFAASASELVPPRSLKAMHGIQRRDAPPRVYHLFLGSPYGFISNQSLICLLILGLVKHDTVNSGCSPFFSRKYSNNHHPPPSPPSFHLAVLSHATDHDVYSRKAYGNSLVHRSDPSLRPTTTYTHGTDQIGLDQIRSPFDDLGSFGKTHL